MPVQWEKAPPYIRSWYMQRYYEYNNVTRGPASLYTAKMNVDEVMRFIHEVQPFNCSKYYYF